MSPTADDISTTPRPTFGTTSDYAQVRPDLRLHFHEAGLDDAAVLVLLHGAGEDASAWSDFAENIPALAAEFHVIAVDLPGFGLSDRPDGPLSLSYNATAVRDLLDTLAITEPVHLLGNCLGGGVATRFALAYPDRVSHLVLMGPGELAQESADPEVEHAVKMLTHFEATPTRGHLEAFLRLMVFDSGPLTPRQVDARFTELPDPAAEDPAALMGSVFAGVDSDEAMLWRAAYQLPHPVLLVWGQVDRVQPMDRGFTALQVRPHDGMHILSGCGPWAREETIALFHRLTTDFLLSTEEQ